jgi:type I restriction enzyme S subunit
VALVAPVRFDQLLEYRFDAECYRAELVSVERRIARKQPRRLDSLASVSDGNHMSIAQHFAGSGVRYLKGAEVSDPFIDDSDPAYIPASVYKDITRAHVALGDVLLSVIGSVGPVAFVTDKYSTLSCSCKLAILRPHAISGAVLAMYLLSPTGQALLLRRNRGSVQQGIVLPDVRAFPVPNFSDDIRKKVERVVASAAADKRRADLLYPEAEAELLERMKWSQLRARPAELTFVREFSRIAANSRADAEYFEPQHDRLALRLNEAGCRPIGAFCSNLSRGVQPRLVEKGEIIVVDSKAVRAHGVEPASDARTNHAFHDAESNVKARLIKGDVLLNSTGRGTLGRAGFYQLDQAGICDNHVTVLRPEKNVCDPIYLALFLNSPAGRAQSDQYQTGSSGQLEIYPQHIKQMLVFLPEKTRGVVDIGWQKQLRRKIEDAVKARTSAKAKLEHAKEIIEESLR